MADAEKIVLGFVVLVVMAALVLTALTLKPSLFPKEEQPNTMQQMHFSKSAFTPFDIELAKKFMDKDNDGKCDTCGMLIDDCIASGMMQCSMDSKAEIGVLGSAHIHANLKVYINGKALDLAKQEYYMKSMMMHLDEHPNPDDAGSVLHMHAKGVPLWIFLESIGMKFDNDCFVTDNGNGRKYCNDGENRLRFYVNGAENAEFGDYIFDDGDKILITYGDETKEDIMQQLASIADFSKNH